MRFNQIGTKEKGVFSYNKERMNHLTDMLFDGRYLISFQRISPNSTVKQYRGCYFVKIDTIALECGYSRYEIHEEIKDSIISQMIEEIPQVFTAETASTKYLTLEGWMILLERLDLWAFTEFNIIL